jgi:hypothetical protein
MSDKPLFQGMDEREREVAPQQVPAEHARVVADEGADVVRNTADPPDAAPVAQAGVTPSGMAAPPNIGDEARGTAPGDPETEARYPIGDEDRDVTR